MSHTRAAVVPITLACTWIALVSGCATVCKPSRPAHISHIVLMKLKDPAETPQLLADADAMVARIPGIKSYVSGTHLDTGRANVDGSYDVGLVIGFDSAEAYQRYVDDPHHVAAVDKWKPHWESVRIYDIVDDKP